MRVQRSIFSVVLTLLAPTVSLAGMPSPYVLTDVSRTRMESLSFFFVLFLASAAMIQLLWNFLQRDFAFLPRLNYGKALALTTLWGLLFIVVLTMISGARELLTPGAWEPNGATYRLKKDAPSPIAPATSPDTAPVNLELMLRRQRIDDLRFALWEYARTRDGQFPPDRDSADLPADKWRVPGPTGMHYRYLPGFRRPSAAPLVLEPELFGAERFVLLRSGEIRLMTNDAIAASLDSDEP